MKTQNQYSRLFSMAVLSFVSMFVLMYAMVNILANVLINLNQVYMTGLMTSAMVIIELVLMKAMYQKRKLNFLIFTISSVALILFFILIRRQLLISDKEFLKSMIPHHAAAILMCEEAPISDPEIKQLCQNIISNQQAEIEQMRSKLI